MRIGKQNAAPPASERLGIDQRKRVADRIDRTVLRFYIERRICKRFGAVRSEQITRGGTSCKQQLPALLRPCKQDRVRNVA